MFVYYIYIAWFVNSIYSWCFVFLGISFCDLLTACYCVTLERVLKLCVSVNYEWLLTGKSKFRYESKVTIRKNSKRTFPPAEPTGFSENCQGLPIFRPSSFQVPYRTLVIFWEGCLPLFFRTIPLSSVATALKTLFQANGVRPISGKVFSLTAPKLTHRWRAAREAIGSPDLRMHDLMRITMNSASQNDSKSATDYDLKTTT